ncbi:ZYBA0S04-08966g1_1 [Zygosaccharomyces bailii CLIB 213]|uniref:ZYBA0S04-08966g1_1 n=1 Tax=Zygosaccharomyces bailii (strain CLIB 213 / ATCC 58445 / CBS 680 / BCRC 21525 / NBRC 1098 / NCYC 1416 / NRRL Y-2227) TaxID=1333698 RepID=A0A8J2T7C7_ZYGB2|nr:ZYBA0S04-08966g1_1 [Zygosaccharomyces bailii CLIB 213]
MINEDTKNVKSAKTSREVGPEQSQHTQLTQQAQQAQQVQQVQRALREALLLRHGQEQEPQRSSSRDSLRSLQQLVHRGDTSGHGKRYIYDDSSSYGTARAGSAARSDTGTTTTNYLRPRMQFTGYQISGYKKYQVVITLKTVNLPLGGASSPSPHVRGFLTIRGLTNQHPEITTFFDAFAVNHSEFGFLSSSWARDSPMGSCRADDQTDLEHWLNFPAFKQLFLSGCSQSQEEPPTLNDIIDGTYEFSNYLEQRFVFMRWKEKYLVPEELADGVEGASYDGFYYIVHDQVTGNIQGFYYHQDAEKFQQLELVPCAETAGDCSSCGFEMA